MINIKNFLLAFFILIFTWQIMPFNIKPQAFAIGNQYSNQLLKLDIKKNTDGTNNIVVYTTKRYKLKLTPIKRSNNEYVVFLPETYHSITSNPDISKCPTIKNVDIKLVPYMGIQSNNGYTKIVLKTSDENEKINVVNEVYNQPSSQNDDLSGLISSHKDVKKVKTANNITIKIKPKEKHVIFNIKPSIKYNIAVNEPHKVSQKLVKTKNIKENISVKIAVKKPDNINKIVKKENNVAQSQDIKIATANKEPQDITQKKQPQPNLVLNQTVPQSTSVQPVLQQTIPQQPVLQQTVPQIDNVKTLQDTNTSANTLRSIIMPLILVIGILVSILLVRLKNRKNNKVVEVEKEIPETDENSETDNLISRLYPKQYYENIDKAEHENHKYIENEEIYDTNTFYTEDEQAEQLYIDSTSHSYVDEKQGEDTSEVDFDSFEDLLSQTDSENNKVINDEINNEDSYYDVLEEYSTDEANDPVDVALNSEIADDYKYNETVMQDTNFTEAVSDSDNYDSLDLDVLENNPNDHIDNPLINDDFEEHNNDTEEEFMSVNVLNYENTRESYLLQDVEDLDILTNQEPEKESPVPIPEEPFLNREETFIMQPEPENNKQDEIHVIEGYEISDQKAFYLVKIEEEEALIGIVNSEIFILNKFNKIHNYNFSVKRTSNEDNKELYYVQIDRWKGLICADDNKMALELAF